MPYSGSVFSNLFNWLTDAIRNPKIQDARLDAEFDGIAAALSTFSGTLNISQTGSGSLGATSPTDFGYPYNRILITPDGYDTSAFASGKQVATGLLIEDYPNNSSKGNRNAFTSACWVPPGATVDTSTRWGYCGALLFGKTDINHGGTNTGAGSKGSSFGGNSYAASGASATNLYGVVAHEFNVDTAVGSSMSLRGGVSIVDVGFVQGSTADFALSVGGFSGSAGFKNLILVSNFNGSNAPLDPTNGRFVYADGTCTARSFAEAPSYTFSDYIFNFNKFSVTGAGKTVITSNALHAIAIGPNGDTSPTFVVAGNVASQATGIAIVGAAAGGGAGITVISSGSNELLAINSLGTGDTYINNSSTGVVRAGNGLLPKTDDQAALGSSTERWADLFLSAGAVINYNNGNYTITHISGALYLSGDLFNRGTTSSTFGSAIGFGTKHGNGGAGFASKADTTGLVNLGQWFNSSGTLVGNIQTDNSTTSYNSSSDRDRKCDARPFLRAAEIIDATEIWDFAWRANPTQRGVGVFAQDAYKVFPNAISPSDKPGEWGADYSKYVPVLIANVKQLNARIAELEKRLGGAAV